MTGGGAGEELLNRQRHGGRAGTGSVILAEAGRRGQAAIGVVDSGRPRGRS